MRVALRVGLFLVLTVVGAWYALGLRGEDVEGAAQLRKWAAGVTAQSASPVKGYRASFDTGEVGAEDWVVRLKVETIPDAVQDLSKQPTTLHVTVNRWQETLPVLVDDEVSVRIPWSAFRLHGRENDISFNLDSMDGTAFGGWAFHSIVFEKGRVGVGKPTWIERVFD